GNSDKTEQQNDEYLDRGEVQQESEIQKDHNGDKYFQIEEKFALRHQVGLAGFINQLGNLPHGAMDRQVFQLHINDQAEQSTEAAKDQSEGEQLVSSHAAIKKGDCFHVRQLQIGLSACLVSWSFPRRVGHLFLRDGSGLRIRDRSGLLLRRL